ncbi:MAG: carbohydrate kinase [Novosphingobium sp.]|nr:carbohydrate kinase [Novosphingobium sp.]MCP5400860.1 carbohydrate kinase [Novosphingobium sp.]
MAAQGAYIVVDIGKTNSKVTLWSRAGELLDRKTRPNDTPVSETIRRLDVDGIAEWIVQALSGFSGHPIEAIVPVAHGAGMAALRDGDLCIEPLDYEQSLPADVLDAYRQQRDPFAQTGSPALPGGLNAGAQLYWLEQLDAQAINQATFLPWAQYWAWFLSGRAVTEVTSLGCHSDLWNPIAGDYSRMAKRKGWDRRFAPVVQASDGIGTIRPDLAAATKLPAETCVLAGLHDSNAALLAARGFPEIADNEATVLSTGTWFIAMRLTGKRLHPADLPEERDCLVNVDTFGRPVPSARFMGGREIETLIEIDTRQIDIRPDQPALLNATHAVLANGAMVLPTLAPGCGPFPAHRHRWINRPSEWFERRAAASLYAALMTDVSLELIGSRECLLVEGRFAEAEVFVRSLASLRPDTRVYTAIAHNDVSFGALRLIDPSLSPDCELRLVEPLEFDLDRYRERWRAEMENCQ